MVQIILLLNILKILPEMMIKLKLNDFNHGHTHDI